MDKMPGENRAMNKIKTFSPEGIRPVKVPVVFCLREARCDFTRRSRKWGRALCAPLGVLKERAFGIEKG